MAMLGSLIALLAAMIVPYAIISIFPQGASFLPREVSYALFGERCTSQWIPKNVTLLKESLESNVFGQHVAIKLIVSTLSHRWSESSKQRKPLVISFHGWTGSGKNFVTKFVSESLFLRGLNSKFVHLFVSTVHFPDDTRAETYRRNLQEWVRGNVSLCAESIFIFDEIDKMPTGVIDGLRSYMDFHEKVDGVDFRRAIFILLSNTGGREITKKAYEFWNKGLRREDMSYSDLEDLISRGAFNEKGGLHHAEIIDRSLVDLYVPFLPLERRHIRQCAERELQDRGRDRSRHKDIIDKVADQIQYWPPSEVPVFATAGCKKVSQKVDEILYTLEDDFL